MKNLDAGALQLSFEINDSVFPAVAEQAKSLIEAFAYLLAGHLALAKKDGMIEPVIPYGLINMTFDYLEKATLESQKIVAHLIPPEETIN